MSKPLLQNHSPGYRMLYLLGLRISMQLQKAKQNATAGIFMFAQVEALKVKDVQKWKTFRKMLNLADKDKNSLK